MAMSDSDDVLGDDPELGTVREEFERHRKALYERISQYMEEEEISEGYATQLLLDATISMRMAAYGLEVESPSVAGLKLDLDRLRREVDDLVRDAKKSAEEYIRNIKELRQTLEEEEEKDEE
jgi:hypothetical protein